MNYLRGLINLSLIIIFSILTALMVFIFTPFVYLIFIKSLRHRAIRWLQHLTVYWIDAISALLRLTLPKKWDFHGEGTLTTDRPYLLICNHQSWIDILVLTIAFHRQTPSIRFFMKKELLWLLPIAGVAAWLLGYPFMGRHTAAQIRKNPSLKNKDILTTRRACQRFMRYPATIMNYLEGTRFTEEKHRNKNSPYQYLLPPKAGGIAIVLQEMGTNLAGVVNATIAYEPRKLSFWQFCCGHFTKIHCHYELLPITPKMLGDYSRDREFRVSFQQWLNQMWQKKDELLNRWYRHD